MYGKLLNYYSRGNDTSAVTIACLKGTPNLWFCDRMIFIYNK